MPEVDSGGWDSNAATANLSCITACSDSDTDAKVRVSQTPTADLSVAVLPPQQPFILIDGQQCRVEEVVFRMDGRGICPVERIADAMELRCRIEKLAGKEVEDRT